MPFDNTGTFNRIHSWEQDRQDGISIDSYRVDEDTDDIANGLSSCMLRDGSMAMEGALDMANFKITNLANGTASSDAVNKGQLDSASSTLNAAITTAVNTMLSNLYPVGSMYVGTQGTCPLSTLIAGSTWTKVATKVVTNVDSTVGVKGTGKTLGLTNGQTNVGLMSNHSHDSNARLFQSGAYNKSVSSSPAGSENNREGFFGVVQDVSTSGLTGVATSTTLTLNIWKRTA